MALIFPDIEKVLVAYFTEELGPEVRVATKHSQPDEELPPMQIVIIVAYNAETSSRVTRLATATIEVYADDYGTANDLALHVDSLIRNATGPAIKRAEVRLGPVRTTEEGKQERRSIDVELVVKGMDT